MLISPSEKTSSDKTACETEISIDFSKIPIESPKTKKNVTIQITSLSNTEDSLSPLAKEKLIRLKIKMPKSPKGHCEIKRDRSFFTEKDFSTLPKEFIKFANSMICGDDPRKEAKQRYCDKSLNEERLVEKDFSATEESEINIPSSTPKNAEEKEEEVTEPPQDRKKIEPLYFTKREKEESKSEFQGVKVCDVIEKKPPYEDIIAKLKPYSKYRMQYLHNLRKLQSKECDKYAIPDFCLPSNEGNSSNLYDDNNLDENEIVELVNRSTRYRPIMGKTALLSKTAKKQENDSEIIKELVTEKFSPFFERRRRQKGDIYNNYSLPIDNISYDKEDKLQKNNNNLNETVHRIFVNEEAYAVVNKNNKLKELEQENNHQEVPNEFSAYSDYDAEKFIQNAIGDVSFSSQAMDASHRSAKRPDLHSEDYSIATGEMSLLVSKASSISTFCSTVWRRITRRNSGIVPQETDTTEEDQEELRKKERNKRVNLLKQEASVQNEIIRQASKALDYCEHLPGVDFLSQRMEAERVILIASHKNKMIQHEIEDVSYYSTIRSACSYLGGFAIRHLQFKVKDVCRKQDECSQWFVCVISRGTETAASAAVQASDDGDVVFKEEFSFDYLPPDFEVVVSVFTLKLKKHKDPRSSFQRLKFFSFRRDPKPAFGRKTLTSRFSRTSLRSPNKDYALPPIPVRQTSFLFLGETTLTIKDVPKTTLTLSNIANFANIFESFTASMSSNVNIDESFSDFLNVGTEYGGNVLWTRRWCMLQDTQFKYWNSPSDEGTDVPLKTLDLTYSVKDVASADRSLCPRARTLQLEIFVGEEEQNKNCRIERYFLTSDTSESMHRWEKSLNSIISTLRAWNCLKTSGC